VNLTGGCFEEVVQTGKGPVKNREQLSLDGTTMMENVRSGGRSCGSEKEESCVPSSGALRELNLDSEEVYADTMVSIKTGPCPLP
jgi:hypothetical protein